MEHLQTVYNIDFSNLNILECGAHRDGSETKRFRSKNNCYYIEANPEDIQHMYTQEDVPSEHIFHFALSDTCGETQFIVTSHLGNSSIDHSEEHKQYLIQYTNSTFHKIIVPCYTYPHFIDNIIEKPIDILVLDIEGHEIHVLKSMQGLPVEKLPKIFFIEAGFDWPERKKLLLDLGYTIDFYHYNNVCLSHQSFQLSKNKEVLDRINAAYPEFIWHGKLIFTNDCSTGSKST